jgi:decaprenylphospho-beta-D-ribofuranose 2-oxidase
MPCGARAVHPAGVLRGGMSQLMGWGRYPVVEAPVVAGEDLARAGRGAILARGLGRAYGDAAVPPLGAGRPVLVSTMADRVLAFDPVSGRLRAEAGLSLHTLARLYLPRGYFTPVSPGTQFVTLGGMVASDIHGKNHHSQGTFGAHVTEVRLLCGDGEVRVASRTENPELFAATLGGMGLTGVILEVEVTLARPPTTRLFEEVQRHGSLHDVFHALRAASAAWPMTVAWIDTTARGAARGRGIVMAGRWAQPSEVPAGEPTPLWPGGIPVPDVFPSGVMNRASITALNTAWYAKAPSRTLQHVVAPHTFFWQLDLATEWNRGYGRRGFLQYQCVMPSDLGIYERFLDRFQAMGGASFVTVFKDCGAEGEGLLSFPKPGTTVAVDVPLRDPEWARGFVRELNAYVLDHGGRVYLAKDAFTTRDELLRMYPRAPQFDEVRRRYDPRGRLQSAQSVRVFGW